MNRPFVASRSFHALCHHKVSNPESESQRWPDTYPEKHGESVYIHTTALTNFWQHYLPHVRVSFVLVSGDTDMTVPDDCPDVAYNILNSPWLIMWFAQNCTVTSHPKLKQLPIGLDLHTLMRQATSWGPQQSGHHQESTIMDMTSRSTWARQPICYSNFHFLMNTRYGHDRREAVDRVPPSLVYYEPHPVPRHQSWSTMLGYKFVLSPHGNGLDCHRTWEALLLGCVPVVKTSPLDPLFQELPVLIVQDWSHVTRERLSEYIYSGTGLEKCSLAYWNNQIHASLSEPERQQRIQCVMDYLNTTTSLPSQSRRSRSPLSPRSRTFVKKSPGPVRSPSSRTVNRRSPSSRMRLGRCFFPSRTWGAVSHQSGLSRSLRRGKQNTRRRMRKL